MSSLVVSTFCHVKLVVMYSYLYHIDIILDWNSNFSLSQVSHRTSCVNEMNQ